MLRRIPTPQKRQRGRSFRALLNGRAAAEEKRRPGCALDGPGSVRDKSPPAMSKMKPNRAAAKRFKVTGKGRVRRPKGAAQHNMIGKSRKRRRRLRDNDMVDATFEKRVKLLLPYG